MTLLRVVVALILALAFQVALGRVWGDAGRYVDVLMVPVVWFAVSGTPRTGMLVGCAAGLLYDGWFQVGTFGLTGFKRTLLGWILGVVGARFDLNHQAGRFVAGTTFSLADSLLDMVLREMLGRQQGAPWGWHILWKALITGFLVTGVCAALDRFGDWRGRRR